MPHGQCGCIWPKELLRSEVIYGWLQSSGISVDPVIGLRIRFWWFSRAPSELMMTNDGDFELTLPGI